MSIKFNTVEEMEAYFRHLEDTIYDDERRMVMRGVAIACNLSIFSQYRKQQGRIRALSHKMC